VLAFIEGPELIIVLVIVLVIFGGSQLPKLARNLGQAKKEFEAGMAEKDKDASGDASSDKS
jgi:sec-independent protein translocase protein TatA